MNETMLYYAANGSCRRDIKHIVIHCSATKLSTNYSVERLKKDHLARGFSNIGYHFYITKDGMIHHGRDMAIAGAHVYGYNANSIGICYEGGLDADGKPKDTRNNIQKQSIRDLLKVLKKRWPQAQILGHRDFPKVAKDCPCFNAKKEYEDIQ